MGNRRRNFLFLAALALAVIVCAAPRPQARIEILAHREGDLAPRRMQAAIDTGIVGFSLLVTWSRALGH